MIFLSPALLRPLVPSMRGVSCGTCSRTRAMWETGEREFVCSLCWMYRSTWGLANAEELGRFTGFVEDRMGVVFEKKADQLTDCADADRIISAIALTSRMFAAQDKMK